ncbi:1925_t:CDS:2, partial [Entrophospora sp. SA101]
MSTKDLIENPSVTRFREYLRIKTVQPNPDYEACKKFLLQQAKEIGLSSKVLEPLEQTKDRWVPPTRVIGTTPKASEDQIPMDVVQRKVKALLNKLTLEKFDIISDQIIEYANKSKFEKDGRILREIIRLIFEKSCDEINFSQMYAQLCRKMMEMIDPEITDENVKNNDGKLVMGGTLFRKYLLNRCQEDFEKGWKVNIPVPSNEKGEPDLLSDEYYSAAKAKRRGLGLIRFIGELFKLSMLTERIMHECIRKLLQIQNANEIPGEEEMESLCKLLTTV